MTSAPARADDAPAFKDPAPPWTADAVRQLAQRGILEGYRDGTFGGRRAITRYEAAVGLRNFMQEIERFFTGTPAHMRGAQLGPRGEPGPARRPVGPPGLPGPVGQPGAVPAELKGLADDQALLHEDLESLRGTIGRLQQRLDGLHGETRALGDELRLVTWRAGGLRHALWTRWVGSLAP